MNYVLIFNFFTFLNSLFQYLEAILLDSQLNHIFEIMLYLRVYCFDIDTINNAKKHFMCKFVNIFNSWIVRKIWETCETKCILVYCGDLQLSFNTMPFYTIVIN